MLTLALKIKDIKGYANAKASQPWLPGSVELDQHGLVLRRQVVEVRVPKLEHVRARGRGGGEQREAEGRKENARSGGHDGGAAGGATGG